MGGRRETQDQAVTGIVLREKDEYGKYQKLYGNLQRIDRFSKIKTGEIKTESIAEKAAAFQFGAIETNAKSFIGIINYGSNMISIRQIKAARVFLGWEQRDLASASGLSLPTIQRMEKLGIERSTVANAQKLQAAFKAAGVVFIQEDGGGAGVRLAKREGEGRG